MTAYYNEHDPFAAQWLRNLIVAGHIAPGDVDTRSIEDVKPVDLRRYTQCHFFAGIGIWSLASRNAGWPDDRQLWTGSCPCQPFSAAGKRAGVADERHLWPAFHHLIRVCRPPVVLGEQVASKDGLGWLEGVQADMEAAGYAFGAVDTCAAGFADDQGNEGFHIRQRLYWGAKRLEHASGDGRLQRGSEPSWRGFEPRREPVRLGDTDNAGSQGRLIGRDGADERTAGPAGLAGEGGLANTDQQVQSGRGILGPGEGAGPSSRASLERPAGLRPDRNGVDWLPCRDGKQRPVESGTFPLAHEDPGRVGRLRAYGNALDAAQAEGFVRAWMECAP